MSRRANVKLSLVYELLDGTGRPPIRALVRVVTALGLRIELMQNLESYRVVGPIKSVVDVAVSRLHRASLEQSPAAHPTGVEFLLSEREALDRLEAFMRSPRYRELLADVQVATNAAPPSWIAEWLVRPLRSLGGRPVDHVGIRGGLELVALQLARAASRRRR